MNRLSLQEMRNLLIKKGRLLYGAVFLFCLVCLYGLYTSQWTKVSDLATQKDDNSKTTLDAKNGRGGSITETGHGKTLTGNGYSVTGRSNSGFSSKNSNKDGEVELATPVLGLAGVLRGQPLDDPFTHPLRNEDMTVVPSSNQSAGNKTNGGNGMNRNGFANSGNKGYGQYGGRQRGHGDSYNGGNGRYGGARQGNSSGAVNGLSGSGYRSSGNPLNEVHVTGIITGSVPMAILATGAGEGCYGIGEGPTGITVQQITAGAVLISGSGGSRWLHVD